MGYTLIRAECANCHKKFDFNPGRVPCIVVRGVKQPLCRRCVGWANEQRVRHGLPKWVIHPDAYEPMDDKDVER